MNITTITLYCSLPSEPHFSRFWYLAEPLSQPHDMLLITSNSKHYDKSFRRPEDAKATSQGRLKVMLLEESGCSKNVSLGRVTNHYRFVKHFEKWLESRRPGGQNVVFSAYLLIATNLLLGKHKARLGYELTIDVQDVWSESLSSVVPFSEKISYNLSLFVSHANQAYRYADALVVVLQIYLDHAKEANLDVPGEAVYIGADFPKFDATPAGDSGDDRIRFLYLGTPSYDYDVETACRGVRRLLDASESIGLHIMGGGPDLDRLRQYACDGIKFYGYIPCIEMTSAAKGYDISVNVIHSYIMQSITNKLSGCMASRKPILSSQVSDEVAEALTLLLHTNYRSGNVESSIKAAKDILKHKDDPVQPEEVVRCFKHDVACQKIASLIERLAHE